MNCCVQVERTERCSTPGGGVCEQQEQWNNRVRACGVRACVRELPWDDQLSIRGEGARQDWSWLAGKSVKQLQGTNWGWKHTQRNTHIHKLVDKHSFSAKFFELKYAPKHFWLRGRFSCFVSGCDCLSQLHHEKQIKLHRNKIRVNHRKNQRSTEWKMWFTTERRSFTHTEGLRGLHSKENTTTQVVVVKKKKTVAMAAILRKITALCVYNRNSAYRLAAHSVSDHETADSAHTHTQVPTECHQMINY